MGKLYKSSILLSACFAVAAIPTVPPTVEPKIVEKNISMDDFSHIKISGNYKVIFQSGPANMMVTGTQKSIDSLAVSSNNGNLSINNKNESMIPAWLNFRRNDDIESARILITTPKLSSLFCQGNTDITVQDDLMVSAINATEQSIVRINKTQGTRTFDIQAKESSNIAISGIESETVNLYSRGNAMIDIDTLHAKESTNISLASDSEVNIKLLEVKEGTLKTSGYSALLIEKAYSNSLNIDLTGDSNMQLTHLFTPSLSCKLRRNSQLQIDNGKASITQMNTKKNSKYHFVDFNPGKLQFFIPGSVNERTGTIRPLQ